MANKTISELAQKTNAELSDVMIIESATTTSKITKDDLFKETNEYLDALEERIKLLEERIKSYGKE